MELTPLVRQALIRFLPQALNAKDRKEFSQIIYDELEENTFFKKDILLFFLKKHNIEPFKVEPLPDEYNDILYLPSTLLTDEVRAVKEKGLLKKLREYELEIFGVGEDFIETNEDGIESINLCRIETLFDLIVAHNLMSNKIPSEDEKEIVSIEDETFYLPLRIMLDDKPCTFFIGDARNLFLDKLNEIGNYHLSLIMPYQKEDRYYLDEDDEEVKSSILVFDKEEHSEESYFKMCYYMVDKINEMIEHVIKTIPDNFIYTDTFYKDEIDIFKKMVMIKNINVTKEIPVKSLLKTLNNNFTEYTLDFFDNSLSDIAEEMINFLDVKLFELEKKYNDDKKLKEQGIALFDDKKKQNRIFYENFVENEYIEYENNDFNNLFDELYD